MADSNGSSFFLGATKSKIELFANGGYLSDVIEKGDVPKTGADTQALSCVIGDGSSGGAAVHVEKIPFFENRHELAHEGRIGGGLRALMIVDAGRKRNACHHLFE